MKLDGRRQMIIDLLMEAGTVSLDDLSMRFGVSKMTIHRDLDELEAAGKLRKVRGGASVETSILFESDYRYRERRDPDAKRRIAHAALNFIESGMTILIADGTTAGLMAEKLETKRPLTVITNNMGVIAKLLDVPGITLLALGGTYSRKFNGFFGIVTEEALLGLRADVAFLSTPALSGLACFHMDHDVVRTKRLMINCGMRAFLLVDKHKFGRTALHHLADLSKFEAIITDSPLADTYSRPLADAGIQVHVAKESEVL